MSSPSKFSTSADYSAVDVLERLPALDEYADWEYNPSPGAGGQPCARCVFYCLGKDKTVGGVCVSLDGRRCISCATDNKPCTAIPAPLLPLGRRLWQPWANYWGMVESAVGEAAFIG